MRIEIAERYRPFSHEPGSVFVLPGSSLRVRAFPARFEVDTLSRALPKRVATVDLSIQGPVEDFTIQQDLEKGCIAIWGHASNGYFRYRIHALEMGEGVLVAWEKCPDKAISVAGEWTLQHQEAALWVLAQNPVIDVTPYSPSRVGRLSLGSSKAQDWSLIKRRMSMDEVFPLWYRLGQWTPHVPETGIGTASLLEPCQRAIVAKAPEMILTSFVNLFRAGFDSGLSPRLTDTDFNGLVSVEAPKDSDASSLYLLTEGSKLIHSLFIQEQDKRVHLLPALPTQFHCGRFVGVECSVGMLSMEWSKKVMRRAVLSVDKPAVAAFVFHGGKERCRLRTSYSDKGRVYRSGESMTLEAGPLWFDNFQ